MDGRKLINVRRLISDKGYRVDPERVLFYPHVVIQPDGHQLHFAYAEHIHHFTVRKVFAENAEEPVAVANAWLVSSNRRELADQLWRNADSQADIDASLEFLTQAPAFFADFLRFAESAVGFTTQHQPQQTTGKLTRVYEDCSIAIDSLMHLSRRFTPEESARAGLWRQRARKLLPTHLLRELSGSARMVEAQLESVEGLQAQMESPRTDDMSAWAEESVHELQAHLANCATLGDAQTCSNLIAHLRREASRDDKLAREFANDLDSMLAKLSACTALLQKLELFQRDHLVFDFWEGLLAFTSLPWPPGAQRCPLFFTLVQGLQEAIRQTTEESYVSLGGLSQCRD